MIVREAEKAGDEPTDITPKDFSVRSTVQEYGGGAFRVSGELLIFSNFDDQRLYKQFLSSKGNFFTVNLLLICVCDVYVIVILPMS